MKPEYIQQLRREAELVRDIVDAAVAMPTEQRKKEALWAQECFREKYPRYRWQDWATKKERSI